MPRARGKRPRFYRRKLGQISPRRGFLWGSAFNRFAMSNAECRIVIYSIPRARDNDAGNINNVYFCYKQLFEDAFKLIDQVEQTDDPSVFWAAVLAGATEFDPTPDFTGALVHKFSLIAIAARNRAKVEPLPVHPLHREDDLTRAVDAYADKMWTMYGDHSNTAEKRRKYKTYFNVADESGDEDGDSDTSEGRAGEDDVRNDATNNDTIAKNSGAIDGPEDNASKHDIQDHLVLEDDAINTDPVNTDVTNAGTINGSDDDAVKGDINTDAIVNKDTMTDSVEGNAPKDDINDENTSKNDTDGAAQENVKEASVLHL
ncbi:hypothetical protein GGR57DRAFT_41897 [Xylariaceae sp. FL1272]|nr:hypothetical protein GGR57DRAFT_41897 [Xylariaceae sp. FL1272]